VDARPVRSEETPFLPNQNSKVQTRGRTECSTGFGLFLRVHSPSVPRLPLRQYDTIVRWSETLIVQKFNLEAAHRHCIRHRAEIEASDICGCFYCLSTYPPSAISEWIDDGQTAICPMCPVDSVLGSASGYPITDRFLKLMQAKYF
jgi:hypothetical protein